MNIYGLYIITFYNRTFYFAVSDSPLAAIILCVHRSTSLINSV